MWEDASMSEINEKMREHNSLAQKVWPKIRGRLQPLVRLPKGLRGKRRRATAFTSKAP